MLSIAVALALQSAQWITFAQEPSGIAPTSYAYDAASLSRRGDGMRVTYRYTVYNSGLPDLHYRIRLEIDCARRRSRPAWIRQSGLGIRSRHLPTPTLLRPYATNGIEAALARRLCPG